MDFEAQLDAVRFLIGKGKIDDFPSVFRYLTKKPFAAKTDILYDRFLRIVRLPSLITPTEKLQIAKILGLDPDQLEKILL